MEKYSDLLNKLQTNMTINDKVHKRFYHSLEVAKMALKLNEILGLNLDKNKVYLAGILHDCAKLYEKEFLWNILLSISDKVDLSSIKDYPQVWHSFAGSIIAKDTYGIDDEEILSAIFYHTTGNSNMTMLEKLIFVSDYIEESRTGDWVLSAREACFKDLDYGVEVVLRQIINYLNSIDASICNLTLKAYNYYNRNGEK